MKVVGFDTETFPFAAGAVIPKLVCASFAERDGEAVTTHLLSNADADLGTAIETLLGGDHLIVGHNIAYDLAVVVAHYPTLTAAVWKALEDDRVRDTMIRERLIDLADTGDLEFMRLPDGTPRHRDYSLAGLELIYLGRDRSHEKEGEDTWRANYQMLDGQPSGDWPDDAARYAREDAEGTLLVYEAQNARLEALPSVSGQPYGYVPTEEFQVGVAFALQLMSAWGVAIDLDKKAEIEAQLREELRPERLKCLLESGILRPPVPGKPIMRTSHIEACAKKQGKKACKCPKIASVTKGKKASINKKALHGLIVKVCEEHGLEVKRKDPTEKMLAEAEDDGEEVEGNIRADKDVLQEIGHLDPALEEYRYRQYLDKLVTTELPRLSGPIVYPRFQVIVETTRTSSFAADEYPSCNIQNVSAVKTTRDEKGEPTGEINVRECYVARGVAELRRTYRLLSAHQIALHPVAHKRARKILCSIDYGSLEFCSMAQRCFEMFGYSVMRDLLNAGKDPHAYLGAQIALHQHEAFAAECDSRGISGDPMAVYGMFKACENSEDETVAKFYKQYRKLAKPVGFGFPGGLGIKKFCGFAKAHPYYVTVTEEQAKELKAIWFATFPEMRDYFAWVEQQTDLHNEGCFSYTSPLGTICAGKSYTSICNGALLQTPAAEGAKLAVFEMSRACYDPAMASVLFGQRILAFVHDELLFEFDYDEQDLDALWALVQEAMRIMVAAMKRIMPDVDVTVAAALMFAWSKDAHAEHDERGRLVPWVPKKFRQAA